MELEFNICNQTLKRIDSSKPADLSNEYLACRFNFLSDDWETMAKFAIFKTGELNYRVAISDGVCIVPFSVLEHNQFGLTVYGVDENDVRVTTNLVWVRLAVSGFVTDYDESSYFNPDMTEELLDIVEQKVYISVFEDTVSSLEASIDTKTDKTVFDDTVVELETGITGKTVSIEKQSVADDGYFSTYVISQGDTVLSPKINIPKDYLLKSASLEQCTVKDEPITGLNVGDWYFDWVLNTKDDTGEDTHLYLNANVLTDVYIGDNESIIISDGVISVKPNVFAFKTHTHTKSDITDFSHNHDERYYTEEEVNTIIENTKNELLNRIHINSTEEIIQTGDNVEFYGYVMKDGKPLLNKKVHFYEVI